MRKYIYILFVLLSQHLYAQTEVMGTIQKSQLLFEMDKGVELMESGKYGEADLKFKYVLENLKPLPSKMAFYVGKNSFYLKQYKQAINWLNKYIALKGTSGAYSREAMDLQKKAEELYVSALDQDTTSYLGTDTLFTHNYVDCGDSEKILCPICKGQTVIIEEGLFGKKYKTCPYSDEKGMLTCDEYNLLLQGKLQPKLK